MRLAQGTRMLILFEAGRLHPIFLTANGVHLPNLPAEGCDRIPTKV
jgi:hypothetical protein